MDISDDSDNDSDYNSVDAERDLDVDEEILQAQLPRLEQALVSLTGRRKSMVNEMWRTLRKEDEKDLKNCLEMAQKNNSFGLFTSMLKNGTSSLPTHLSKEARTRGSSSSSGSISSKKHTLTPTVAASITPAVIKSSPAAATAIKGKGAKCMGKGKVTQAAAKPAKTAKASRNIKENASVDPSHLRRRQRQVLSLLFGATEAKELLKRVKAARSGKGEETQSDMILSKSKTKGKSATTKKASSTVSSDLALSISTTGSNAPKAAAFRRPPAPSALQAAITQALRGVRKKTVVKEVRRFAGQSIEVERTEMGLVVKDQFADDDLKEKEKETSQNAMGSSGKVPSSSSSSAAASSGGEGKGGGLDSVLATIKGPQSVNTVTKSAFDWQSHKAKEGLEDELKDAAKGGYLSRKDFLERVDVRTYEKERDARMIEQATRKK